MSTISEIYQGGYSTFNPDYGDLFTGYRASISNLGITTNPGNADVLAEVAKQISTGAKSIEVEELIPKTFDSMPKQYFKEINRLSKLTGVDLTAHGPLVEPSGMSQQGFTEASRLDAERQIKNALIRSHDLKPHEPIIVNFHTSNMFPSPEITKTKQGEEIHKMYIVNQETGQINAVKKEKKYYPGDREVEHDVFQEINTLNNTEWLNSITSLAEYKKHADEIMGQSLIPLAPVLEKIENGEKITGLTPEQLSAHKRLQRANVFLENVEASFSSMYNKTYKYADEQGRDKLKEISEQWKKERGEMEKVANELNLPVLKSRLLDKAIEKIQQIPLPPQTYVPLDKFMMEKSATSFGNAAFDSYKKFGGTAPILTIENPPANQQFSRGKDVREMVEKAREKFVEKAVKEGAMSKSEAVEQAKRLIGATWDVSHINLLRRSGFEEKDLLKETEIVAPFVKHVHLADNFGFEHTELPMGTGNVPLKKMMEKLGKSGEEAKKIIEAADWQNAHKQPHFPISLEGIGSPIYSMKMQPYWNQSIGFKQDYFAGYGEMLPPIHFETFGAGFSNLPQELGGRTAGSRVTGRPME